MAGAAGVAIANAMTAAANDETKLLDKLKVMDVDSFYGKLKWTSTGTSWRWLRWTIWSSIFTSVKTATARY